MAIEDQVQKQTFQLLNYVVNCAELSENQLFTASHKEAILFDLQTQKMLAKFQHGTEVYKLKSNNDTLVSCGRDKVKFVLYL